MHIAETLFIVHGPLCDMFGRMKNNPRREIKKAVI
ncbi:hypothetical protein PF005_g28184 [Phytophthora fragariae]|uniref:Uncharacterized protein n=1 Tax=Phytophthora fragariae TaxID=53985 RepID=A0A6A3DMJ9_9STRA|nr:hypothetical protein PF003_g3120 [Phytophthora fragariae]KAE8920987.1 hypothetical protein PF009_g28728 [Phytophthora fragariae]KAE8968451.1 hypothetical protein PF011_g27177 [Phytophthora fragariae]KAE9066768.1 hypothetical protein PF010_g27735 [Phytophthora fragariae]KAE9067257.1 hypothetical protein PF007_g28145 [Phytophthora fragariae]